MTSFRFLVALALSCLGGLAIGQAPANENALRPVVIGVLAYNGDEQALARWSLTAEYLGGQINDRVFRILPLTHEDFVHAINKGQIDFTLTNPGHYIALEIDFGATRIATFKTRYRDQALTRFGSVIFCLRDGNIETLEDLKGRTLAAVSEEAFGGFQLARAELLNSNLRAPGDIHPVWLGFPQRDIVRAVLSGKADAGTVRTGILEKMAESGELDLDRIRILGQRQTEGFPLLHSSELYPEWPIARLPQTDAKLASQVAIALLQMPESSPPALAAQGAGWTIPFDYRGVHELFRRLSLPPYLPDAPATGDTYREWALVAGLLLLVCVGVMVYTLRTNRELQRSQQALSSHRESLERSVRERTVELSEVNRELQQDIEARIQFEQTLHEGCDILHALYTVSSRDDLNRLQRIQSILDLARQYLGREIGVISVFDGERCRIPVFNSGCEPLELPLDRELSLQAQESGQVIQSREPGRWRSYLACAYQLSTGDYGLLEFASARREENETADGGEARLTELSLRILTLIAQWAGHELGQLETEDRILERQTRARSRFTGLTRRERQVLQLVADGESNKNIARLLDISTKTVELHRANLIRKSGTNSSIQLVKLATAAGIVD